MSALYTTSYIAVRYRNICIHINGKIITNMDYSGLCRFWLYTGTDLFMGI